MSEKNYIQMMEDSLEKKIDILRQLQVLCEEQKEILEDPASTPEALEENVERKEQMIQKLAAMDDGFEQLYQRVEGALEEHRETYRENIARMQEMIRDITQRSARLQVQEQRNKELAKQKFGSVRAQIKELRQSSRAVTSYYQNMTRNAASDPQFMDSKK